MSQLNGTDGTSGALTVEQVIHGFHQFLQYSLSQAKFEKIIDEDTLASAEADVMICGPALCLYFAALRSNTTPPSCPIPGSAQGSPPLILSNETCPPLFLPFFKLWQNTVPEIQALQPTYQHDLARVICDNAPLTSPNSAQLQRISADLRSVAIEISQRRTFQDRYRHDLQAALDVGQPTMGEKRRVASFQPPPSYEESSEPSHSPVPSVHSSPRGSPRGHGSLPPSPRAQTFAPPSSPPPTQGGLLAAPGPASFGPPPGPPPGTVASGSGSQRPAQGHGRTRSDALADTPAIDLIRETLYASLADVISTTPSIRSLLKSDPPRAYFSSVALAILGVCRNNVTPTGTLISVVGRELILQECPVAYRPLMTEFVGISSRAKQFELEDDQRAIRAVQRGKKPEEPRLDRLKRMLETSVAGEEARYDREGPTAPRPPPKDQDPALRPVGAAGHYRCHSAAASTSSITTGAPPYSTASSPRTSSESPHGRAANLLRKSPRSQNGHLPRPVSPARPMTSSYIQPAPPRRSAEQEEAPPRRSEEGTTVQLANRVNALALKMTGLKLFRERSDMIFAILQSVS